MKLEKKNIVVILSAILILQIIILVFSNVFSLDRLKIAQIEKRLVNGLKNENIKGFEIKDYQDSFSITKTGDKWFVETKGKKLIGNKSKIAAYIETVVNLTGGIIVNPGKDPANDINYGFTEKTTQTLAVKTNNGKDFVINIGGTGTSKSNSYIRFKDEKSIREINSGIATETSNIPANWAEKVILADVISESSISTIEINSRLNNALTNYKIVSTEEKVDKSTKYTYSLEPAIQGKEIDSSLIQTSVLSLINLSINDYVLDGTFDGKENPASIKITDRKGKVILLNFYKADPSDTGKLLLKTDQSEFIYLVNEDVIKNIIKDAKEFVKK